MFNFLKKKNKDNAVNDVSIKDLLKRIENAEKPKKPDRSVLEKDAELVLSRKALSIFEMPVPTENDIPDRAIEEYYADIHALKDRLAYRVMIKTLMEGQTAELLTKAETENQLSFARGVLYGLTLFKEEVDNLSTYYVQHYSVINGSDKGDDV